MKRTLDAAPVAYEGTINGRHFYFRARYQEWFFGVADTVEQASIADYAASGTFVRTGKYGSGRHAASYMPYPEAEHIIRQSAMAYLNDHPAQLLCEELPDTP